MHVVAKYTMISMAVIQFGKDIVLLPVLVIPRNPGACVVLRWAVTLGGIVVLCSSGH